MDQTRFQTSRTQWQGHTTRMHIFTPTKVPAKYQLPTPCGFRDVAPNNNLTVKVTVARSKDKGHTRTLNTYTLNQCPHQV